MQVVDTMLHDVKIVRPSRFGDDRGWFAEVFNASKFASAGLPTQFVQDNQSFSAQGVLRGMHYQLGKPQGKLVRVLSGHIWDVAIDLRRGSPTFGRHVSNELSADNGRQLFIPSGFGHLFITLEADVEVAYKVSSVYVPDAEGGIAWDDPAIGIVWPLANHPPITSPRDAELPTLTEFDSPFLFKGA